MPSIVSWWESYLRSNFRFQGNIILIVTAKDRPHYLPKCTSAYCQCITKPSGHAGKFSSTVQQASEPELASPPSVLELEVIQQVVLPTLRATVEVIMFCVWNSSLKVRHCFGPASRVHAVGKTTSPVFGFLYSDKLMIFICGLWKKRVKKTVIITITIILNNSHCSAQKVLILSNMFTLFTFRHVL